MKFKKILMNTAVALVGIGAVNWGLQGVNYLMDKTKPTYNLLASLLVDYPTALNTIYVLVGLSGVYTLWWLLFGKKK